MIVLNILVILLLEDTGVLGHGVILYGNVVREKPFVMNQPHFFKRRHRDVSSALMQAVRAHGPSSLSDNDDLFTTWRGWTTKISIESIKWPMFIKESETIVVIP